MMKKTLLLTILSFWIIADIFGAHIVGGDITYRCLGPGAGNNMNYRFEMKVYRDCFGQGAGFDSGPNSFTTGTITVYRGTSLTPFIRSIDLDAPEISQPLTPNANNPCLDPPEDVCVEEGTYIFTRPLPISTESYYIVYQRCCRNGTITNIFDPGGTGSTYYVEITPEAQQSCNNSPIFRNFPPLAICVNEPLSFDHSAADAEGDQLVYEFCSPLTGGTRTSVAPDPDGAPSSWQDVDFILPNYSPTNPVGGNPQIQINPATGEITGTPNIEGQYVVGICVKEYRNGQLLSTLQRDFQFNVVVCEAQVNANLDGIDAGAAYVFNSCTDSTITIINRSTREEFIDEYLWLFDDGDIIAPLSFNTRDITVTFPGPGEYFGLMILNPGTDCSDTAEIEVYIAAPINADFEFDYDTCVAGPVTFFDQTPDIGRVYDYEWSFGDANASSESSPVHNYISPGLRNVTMKVTDQIGCEDEVIKQVNWFPVPPLIIIDPSAEVGCAPLDVVFTNLSTPVDNSYEINWDFGDGTDIIQGISPGHVYQETGIYTINVDITSPIGCFTSREFPFLIEVDSPVVANFTYEPQMGISNFEPRVNFFDQSRQARAWDWTFGDFGSTIIQNPSFVFPDTGLQLVTLVATHFYGCQDTVQYWVDVVPEITFFMPNAFTPNSDDTNDFFRPGGFFRGIRNYQMQIFDRWGGLVFEADDPMQAWNGKKNNTGKALPKGIYVCRITYASPRGGQEEVQGYVTLFR